MIVYTLMCPKCGNVIENDVNEMAFLNVLVNQEMHICADCNLAFIPEDDHFKGALVAA